MSDQLHDPTDLPVRFRHSALSEIEPLHSSPHASHYTCPQLVVVWVGRGARADLGADSVVTTRRWGQWVCGEGCNSVGTVPCEAAAATFAEERRSSCGEPAASQGWSSSASASLSPGYWIRTFRWCALPLFPLQSAWKIPSTLFTELRPTWTHR
jgi:hypothetical protein